MFEFLTVGIAEDSIFLDFGAVCWMIFFRTVWRIMVPSARVDQCDRIRIISQTTRILNSGFLLLPLQIASSFACGHGHGLHLCPIIAGCLGVCTSYFTKVQWYVRTCLSACVGFCPVRRVRHVELRDEKEETQMNIRCFV